MLRITNNKSPYSPLWPCSLVLVFLVLSAAAALAWDQPFDNAANWGGTGLMEIPTARILDDGVIRGGVAQALPYRWFAGGMGIFPGLEASGRVTQITNIPSALGPDYGSNKDKAFDLKYQILPESKWFPALAVGLHDFHGTKLFEAQYLVMSRQIFPLDFTVGFGRKRLHGPVDLPLTDELGLFGGIEWALHPRLHFMAEYNPIEYEKDRPSARGVPEGADWPVNFGLRVKVFPGVNVGISFQRGDTLGLMAHIQTELGEPVLPLRADPPPQVSVDRRPFKERDPRDMVEAIHKALRDRGFRDVSVYTDGRTLSAEFENTVYLSDQKAVGRVLRVLLVHAPSDAKTLSVVVKKSGMSILKATVEPDHLEKYLLGEIPDEIFAKLIRFEFTDGSEPEPVAPLDLAQPVNQTNQINQRDQTNQTNRTDENDSSTLRPVDASTPGPVDTSTPRPVDTSTPPPVDTSTPPPVEVSTPGRLDAQKDRFSWGIKPEFQSFINDPSGFFKFKVGAKPWTVVNLWKGGDFYTRLDLPFYSDISSSNVPPPDTIREDSWKYLSRDYTFEHLMFDQTVRLWEHSFARFSVGYLESMYAGVGGEVLSFLGEGNLALGLQSDWVRKREPGEPLALKDFDTYTLLANGYYHMPELAITLQTQYGRFMAGDVGWLFRASREYDTGVVIGAWYSLTDTDDLQGFSRGYNDKGVFLRLPARIFLTRESPRRYTYTLAPWTRDAAATVEQWRNLFEIGGNLTPARFKSRVAEIKD